MRIALTGGALAFVVTETVGLVAAIWPEAWLGLFGVPVLTLVALVVGLTLPQWLSVLFMAWFVGGFGFLVASMRSGPRDGHDDGAVL